MQIHELPSASPSASDYIPIDNGTATRKATLSSIDMGSNEITFTSGDTSSPSSWQTVAVMASNTAANLMNAISKMIANIRWLYNRLGTSAMGTTATTLTGAIAEVNDSVNDNTEAISELNSNLNYKSGDSFSARTWRAMGRVTNAGNAIYCWIDLGKPITASGFTVNIGSINTFGGISPTYSGTTSSHSISGNELIFALNLSNSVAAGSVVLLEFNNTVITLT